MISRAVAAEISSAKILSDPARSWMTSLQDAVPKHSGYKLPAHSVWS
jgi:hypothetical protein